MRLWGLFIFLLALAASLCLSVEAQIAGGQPSAAELGEEEAGEPQPEEPEQEVPQAPVRLPGYFPQGSPPIAASTLELSAISSAPGPALGMLAPYGNSAAFDTLLRGWKTHELGPVRASPYLEWDGLYRTNVFLTSADKKSSFVNIINPGVRFELPLAQRHKISVGYLGNYFLWSRFSNFSHYDHNANVEAALDFPGGLSVQVGNAFRYATEEPSGVQARKRPYYRDNPYVLTAYGWADRWKIQGFYQFDLLHFKDDADRVNNYRQHAGGVALSYKFWPKTAALAQYIVAARTYPDNPLDNHTSHTPFIGLIWEPTAKISGTAKFGYTFTGYHRQIPGRDNSPESFAMSVQALYRYSRYTSLSLTLQRSKQDDLDAGNNNPFWNTGVFVALNRDWHYFKMASYVSFAYFNNSYINATFDDGAGRFKKREDQIYFLSAGLSRSLTRGLRLRADYSYINRSSNFSGNTYNDHRVLVGLQTSL